MLKFELFCSFFQQKNLQGYDRIGCASEECMRMIIAIDVTTLAMHPPLSGSVMEHQISSKRASPH